MSKAFTKDDDDAIELLVAPRAPLPTGLPNYVTTRGWAQLQAERRSLERARAEVIAGAAVDREVRLRALTQRLAQLQLRIASANCVDETSQPRDEVRFGARVRVRAGSGEERSYEIVGVDEANAERGLIAFSAPLSRALLGKRLGESFAFRTPRADDELTVLEIAYERPAEPPEADEVGP